MALVPSASVYLSLHDALPIFEPLSVPDSVPSVTTALASSSLTTPSPLCRLPLSHTVPRSEEPTSELKSRGQHEERLKPAEREVEAPPRSVQLPLVFSVPLQLP